MFKIFIEFKLFIFIKIFHKKNHICPQLKSSVNQHSSRSKILKSTEADITYTLKSFPPISKISKPEMVKKLEWLMLLLAIKLQSQKLSSKEKMPILFKKVTSLPSEMVLKNSSRTSFH